MLIIQAGINDLPGILSLQKAAFHSQAELVGDFSIPPMTQTLAGITEDFHAGVILKAIAKDNPDVIVGSVRGYVREGTLYIGRLVVYPSYQGQGIGGRLLLAIEALYPDFRYELFTSNISEKALLLYTKNGYKIFRREALNEQADLVFLEKHAKRL